MGDFLKFAWPSQNIKRIKSAKLEMSKVTRFICALAWNLKILGSKHFYLKC